MAKLRSVNTEFWTDEYIGDRSRDEKLLFLYFLTNPLTRISGAYKISKRVIMIDTGLTLSELDAILARFEADEKVFYRDGWVLLPNFLRNQSFNDNMRKNAINEVLDAPKWIQVKIRQVIKNSVKLSADFERLSNLVERLSTEFETLSTVSPNRIGIEDEDEDEDEYKYKTEKPPQAADEPSFVQSDVKTVFEEWQKVLNKPRHKLDKKRTAIIKARLKDGYSVPDLCKVPRGVKNDPWYNGDNPGGKMYHHISLVFRDADQVDKFIDLADNPPQKQNGKPQVNNTESNAASTDEYRARWGQVPKGELLV